ncbi:MAG TPA: serine hydrolase, partial [Gemmatimonadales bacterium]|nr:serine hydrolase [Gemmatimonadales bacterium]
RIFRPLGMADTRWHWDHTAIYPNRAQGYAPRGTSGGFRIAMSQFSQFAGPGGVHTTVVDLLRWFQNYDSAWVGTRDMLNRMQQPGRLANGGPVPAGGGSHYGLGLAIGSHRGLRTVSHGGSWAGYRAHVLRFPDQDLGVACLCNVTNAGPDTLAVKTAEAYLAGRMAPDTVAAWIGAVADAAPAALAAADLQAMTGYWRNDSLGEVRRIRLAGDSLLYGLGDPARLVPLEARRARLNAPGQAFLELQFAGDSAGVPTRMTARSRGGVTRWYRVVPPSLTAAQRREYAGEWYSPELEVTWTITADSNALTISRGRRRAALESVGRDAFADRGGGALLEFRRAASGRLEAMLVQSGRVRNLRFARRPASSPTARAR